MQSGLSSEEFYSTYSGPNAEAEAQESNIPQEGNEEEEDDDSDDAESET